MTVRYHDGHVKRQAWTSERIEKVTRLVFDPEFMDKRQRKAINRKRRNWQRNPCMCVYLRDEKPVLICQRSGDGTRWLPRVGAKNQPTPARGWPVGIDFRFFSNSVESYYHFGESWVSDTGELHFQRDLTRNGGFAITRVIRDGTRTELDVMTAGARGMLPCRIEPDGYSCWGGSPASHERC